MSHRVDGCKDPQNGSAVAPALEMKGVADPIKHVSFSHVTMLNLIAIDQTVRAYVPHESTGKIEPIASRPSWSLKVIESGTDQTGTYDFCVSDL